jgi:hypothetical protein
MSVLSTLNLHRLTLIPGLADGSLTVPDGSPDGSNFCKFLQSRNVDGLTGFLALFSGILAWPHSFVTARVTPLLRVCYGSDLNSDPILPRCYGCYGSRGGEGGYHHVLRSCCHFVAVLLRVAPQFRFVFTELLRMLRVGTGEGGVHRHPYSSVGNDPPNPLLHSTENSEEPLTGETPLGRPRLGPASPTCPTKSRSVQPGPTQSNPVQPNPTTPPPSVPLRVRIRIHPFIHDSNNPTPI